MARETVFSSSQIDQIAHALRTLPRSEVDRLVVDAARRLNTVFGVLNAPVSEDAVRTKVQAMTIPEIAAIIAPFVRLTGLVVREKEVPPRHGSRGLNPAQF